MIQYRIFQTKLRSVKQFAAKVNLLGSQNRKKLVSLMHEMGLSQSPEEVEATLKFLKKTIVKLCSQGYAVYLDEFIRFEPVITGPFESAEDHFKAPRNQIKIRAAVTKEFQKNFEGLFPQKLPSVVFAPVFHVVENLATGHKNWDVSREQVIRLRGERLRGLKEEGKAKLYFVNAEEPEQKTGALKPYSVTDTEILLILPPVTFVRGYFELYWNRDLSQRVGRSVVLEVLS